MRDITENNSSKMNEEFVTSKKVTLYRSKRFFFPLFVGLLTGLLTLETKYGPALGFLIFISSGLFLDWWYFQYKKYKDSKQVSEEICQSIGITGNQIDELNQYMVTARRASLAVSISITAALVLFSDSFNWQATLILSYIFIVSLIVILGMITKKVIVPYTLDNAIGKQPASSYITPGYQFSSDYSNNFQPIEFQRDSFNPFDLNSSAASWPGGILDPHRHD